MDDNGTTAEVIRAVKQMDGLHNAVIPPPMDCSVRTYSNGGERPVVDYLVGRVEFSNQPPAPSIPFFDARIVPGFGSATKTTIDLGELRAEIIKTVDQLLALYEKLGAAPS